MTTIIPLELESVLLRYSRAVLEHGVRSRSTGPGPDPGSEPEPKPPEDDMFHRKLGVFVTLRRGGALRGCIGSITGEESLIRAVRRRTLDAAFHDHRFSPLREDELPDVTIEHSILSPLRPVTDPATILPGEHGVVLSCRGHRGVFLPEVAVQQGWGLEEMLDALSVKAGLERRAWQEREARLEVFCTQHFGER